jgi:hypothetical protein
MKPDDRGAGHLFSSSPLTCELMSHAETRTQRLAAMRGIHIDRLGGPQQITEDREHMLVAFLFPEVLARLRDLPAPA